MQLILRWTGHPTVWGKADFGLFRLFRLRRFQFRNCNRCLHRLSPPIPNEWIYYYNNTTSPCKYPAPTGTNRKFSNSDIRSRAKPGCTGKQDAVVLRGGQQFHFQQQPQQVPAVGVAENGIRIPSCPDLPCGKLDGLLTHINLSFRFSYLRHYSCPIIS